MDAVDAVVLGGGSVYGLAAADGVTAVLGARQQGFRLSVAAGVPPSPIVPAAILYDLANGGAKDWGEEPPYRALGRAALAVAAESFALGTAGAGYGAMAGRLKGGVGSASIVGEEGLTVGAIAAVNSFGSVVAPGGRTFWAAPYEIDGEFGGLGSAGLSARSGDWGLAKGMAEGAAAPRANTTIACIATDATLERRRSATARDHGAGRPRPRHPARPRAGRRRRGVRAGHRPQAAGGSAPCGDHPPGRPRRGLPRPRHRAGESTPPLPGRAPRRRAGGI